MPIVIIALAAGARLLPESRDSRAGRFDPLGAVLSVAGAGLLVWTVIEAPRHGWTSPVTMGGFAGTAVILAGFAFWQVRRPDPMLDVRLFADARFSAARGAIALAFFGLFGFIFLITQYFQVVRGYDTLRAGVATLPFAVVTGAMSPVAIAVMKRVGTKLVVAGGLVVMSTGFVVAAGVGGAVGPDRIPAAPRGPAGAGRRDGPSAGRSAADRERVMARTSLTNLVPAAILSSPLHRLLSSKRLVLTFTGRRSGTRYTTPVNYLQRGREVLITTDSK